MNSRMMPLLAIALGALLGTSAGCKDEVNQVQFGDPCASINDCRDAAEPLACSNQRCVAVSCTRTGECPAGAACVAGLCTLAECLEDGDCAGDARCFEGACRDDLCDTRADCGADRICTGTPSVCVTPPPICARDEDCPAPNRCDVVRGACVPECAADAACATDAYCDPETRVCRRRCTDRAECTAPELCINEKCALPPDCADAPACQEPTRYRRPEDCACVSCLTDDTCDADRQEACVEGSCRLCLMKTADAALCAARGEAWDGVCCVACVDTADCDTTRGESCVAGRCLDLLNLTCETDADCPSGKVCDGQRCATSPSLGMCTRQADCPQGEACYADGLCRAEAQVCDQCPAPGRCVASPEDTLGTCAGCLTHCAQDGCPDGTLCQVLAGEDEGRCVDAAALALSCP